MTSNSSPCGVASATGDGGARAVRDSCVPAAGVLVRGVEPASEHPGDFPPPRTMGESVHAAPTAEIARRRREASFHPTPAATPTEEQSSTSALTAPARPAPDHALEAVVAGPQAATIPELSDRRAAGAALLGIAIGLLAFAACAALGLLLADAIFHPGGLG